LATSTSYLQPLSSTEANAFTTSLQKVQAHLQQELEWMNQQMQQKKLQLQGIETLLAEASTLGLLETDAGMISAPVAAEAKAEPIAATAAGAAAPTQPEPAVANDAEAIADVSEAVPTQESASSPDQVAAPSKAAQGEPTASKPPAKTKSQKSSAAKTATKKKPDVKSQSRPKTSKAQPQSKSRALLRPEFADVSLADAVAQVLAQAAEPLHVDQLVSEMYEAVSGEDLKRVKASLANILSKGKRSGKWRNVGNGMYQIKT
jgi:hypothetical protein